MRNFDLYLSKRWSFVFSDACLTQCTPCESYSSNWSQNFMPRVSPILHASREFWWLWVLRDSYSTLVVAFSVLKALFRLFIWLFFNLLMREQTLVSSLTTRFIFNRIGTRADANIHKAISCKYISNSICTVVEESYQSDFCLWRFFSSTHFEIVSLMAQKVWRLWVQVFAHDRYSHAENCTGLPSNTGLFLSTDNRYLLLLQRLTIPFDSWPLLLFRFSRVWRLSFAIGVSDLFLFTMVFNFW